MAVRSKTTLFNAALYSAGLRPSDQTNAWEAMDAVYDEIVRAAFEDAHGTVPFGKGRVTLTSRSAGTFGYDDSYALPDDVIQVTEVFLNERSAADILEMWEIDGINNALLVDSDSRTVEIEYIKAGQESRWSANFALAVQYKLEAVLKRVMEEEEEAGVRDQMSDFNMMKANINGAKSRSKNRVFKRGSGRLLRARSAPFRRGSR